MAQIMTEYGLIDGCIMDGYTVYKGIPYAKPPVGERRFKAPEKPDPWEGIYHADKFADIPIQELPKPDMPVTGRFYKEFYSNKDFIPEMSEDCLYLNIWTPNDAEEKKLPVAFWIHGGGFGGGYSSELEFDGEAFCKKDVILVTVEYRCNIFGFLAHPWLDAENERGISGNYGIFDQIAALEWVYNNIGAFGGDPHNITIFGQSAGSMSTQILISSELTKDMPAKAILQSGITCQDEFLYTPTLVEEEEIGKRMVELSGAKNLEELRSMPAEQLFAAKCRFDEEAWKMGKGLVVVPNADGYLLKAPVGDIWNEGKMKQIPYMLGSVTDDLGAEPEKVALDLPGKLHEENILFSKKAEEVSGQPGYIYFFSRRPPGDDWGAFHSCELWYMFGTLGRCWRPMEEHDYKLSEEMVTCWTNFMKTGCPESEETSEWKPYTKDREFIKEFK